MKKYRINLVGIAETLFVIVTFLLIFYRVTLHADIYDEIINLNISYRIVLGDIPFYNCWEAFQSGDVFLAPFIWAYIKIFGTTSGLVLYSRFIYLVVLLLLSVLAYTLFSKYMSKKMAFFLSYIIVFFELYSLFYLWYDTISVIFLLLGDILIVKAMENAGKAWRMFMFSLAGFVHCCMVFSYPSFIVLAFFMVLIIFLVDHKGYKNTIEKTIIDIIYYAMGALIFISILLMYFQIAVGVDSVFEVLKIITGIRGTNSVSLLDILKDIIIAYVSVNKYLIPVTVLCMILYFRALKKEKLTPIYLILIIVLPAFNQLFIGSNTYLGLANYLSYIALWCPFLFYLLKEKGTFDVCLLFIFYLPSMISSILISSTTVYADIGPVKCWQACLPGALATLYFYIKIWKQNEIRWEIVPNIMLKFVIIVLIFNSYSYVYLNQPYIQKTDERIVDGLYWGIKVNPSMKKMVDFQVWLQEMTTDCETILVGPRLRAAYLMTDLKPMVFSVESPWYRKDGEICWDMSFEYFEYFEQYPDVICVESYEIDNSRISELLNEKYYLKSNIVLEELDICLYVLNENENK